MGVRIEKKNLQDRQNNLKFQFYTKAKNGECKNFK